MANRTNNDLQNITHKTKERVTRTPLKTEGELRCSGRGGSSYQVIFHRGNCIKTAMGITYLKCQYASRRDIKTRLTRPVTSVEQELPPLPEHLSSPSVFSGVRVTRSFVLCVLDGSQNPKHLKISIVSIH
jgi:hypothetical protein